MRPLCCDTPVHNFEKAWPQPGWDGVQVPVASSDIGRQTSFFITLALVVIGWSGAYQRPLLPGRSADLFEGRGNAGCQAETLLF
jgi:hypothetical protein